jgi:hypothetical protein
MLIVMADAIIVYLINCYIITGLFILTVPTFMQDLENIFMATGSNCQTVLITNEGAGQRTGDRAPEDRAPEDRTPEVRTDK